MNKLAFPHIVNTFIGSVSIFLTYILVTVIYLGEVNDLYLKLGVITSASYIFFASIKSKQDYGFIENIFHFLKSWSVLWLMLVAVLTGLKETETFSRVVIFSWLLVSPVLLFVIYFIISFIPPKFYGLESNKRNALIIGDSKDKTFKSMLLNNHISPYKNILSIDSNEILSNGENIEKIEEIILKNRVNSVFINGKKMSDDILVRLLNIFENIHCPIYYLPNFHILGAETSKIQDINGIQMAEIFSSPLQNTSNKFNKRLFDILFSLFGLIMLIPLFILISIGVKISSPGPIIYKQHRMTANNQIFKMYKFRSMPVETNDSWGGSENKVSTRFGKFIRRTSIDELPQLLNVLRGEMSLVGPRPEQEKYVNELRKNIPKYMRKHAVRAGITGLAQINGFRGDTDLESRIELDLYYIKNWSFILDIRIMLMTIFKIFYDKSAK